MIRACSSLVGRCRMRCRALAKGGADVNLSRAERRGLRGAVAGVPADGEARVCRWRRQMRGQFRISF
ncbi:hypothetical protein D1820_18480 (plasmid) [Phaeobacter sp. LSS9]|nr:hypothetical protein D1820_18480 [Phaeobacter sp. LSS9]